MAGFERILIICPPHLVPKWKREVEMTVPPTSWACIWGPPENAVVISVDEKPAIQALERAQGWLRLPNGQAVRGHNHEYKRHTTTTLFAALEVHTGDLTRTGAEYVSMVTRTGTTSHQARLFKC